MKNVFIISLITIVFIGNLVSQAPNLMSYQAVIWDASGNLVSEKMVSIKISILQGSVTGTSVYSETHRVQTNINGLVSLMIGGGSNSTGKISDINWGGGSYFLKTETDPSGGVNFSIIGTTQLVSVPYSLYSGIAGNISTKNTGLPGQTLTIDKDGKMSWVSNLPVISTIVITDIKPNSSVSGGNVVSDSGSPVTSRGVVWSTNPNPTISLTTKTNEGTGIGIFISNLTGLISNTTYYVRAYATNSVGTSYGNEVSFNTLVNLPILSTTPISALTSTTALSGGNITVDGGSPVTTRGVVWSTNPNPTISLSTKTIDGLGIGSYSSSISGLIANTIYYIRGYATNIAGTGYGNELSFNTSTTCAGSPTIRDTSGNVYNTIQIGTQCWMKENLKTSKYRDGENITNVIFEREKLTTGAWSYYLDDSYYSIDFGNLYNWYAATDSRGICPKDWHLPSTDEWQILRNFVGERAGSKLKEEGKQYWFSVHATDSGPFNSSNFSARGTGRWSGGFGLLRELTSYWTGNSYDNSNSIARTLNHASSEFPVELASKSWQLSIRCLKDTINSTPIQKPTISTTIVNTIETKSAFSGGNIISDGGASITARGVVWSTSTNPTIALTTKTSNGTGTGSFTSTLTNLTPKTTYYVRAYATNSAGTGYGNEITFTTLDSSSVMGIPCLGTPTVKDIDGNTYNTVQIGTQCWTKENLRVTKYRDGSVIPLDESGGTTGNGTGQTWSSRTTGARTVYGHNAANLATYGYLYNWYAVAEIKGLCPNGWHVPSDSEWTTLSTYLGGETVAGGKMKSTGTTYWISNAGATNSSGFSVLPGGYRNYDGSFGNIRYNAFFWSTSTFGGEYGAFYRHLSYDSGLLGRSNHQQVYGFSVRCLRD